MRLLFLLLSGCYEVEPTPIQSDPGYCPGYEGHSNEIAVGLIWLPPGAVTEEVAAHGVAYWSSQDYSAITATIGAPSYTYDPASGLLAADCPPTLDVLVWSTFTATYVLPSAEE